MLDTGAVGTAAKDQSLRAATRIFIVSLVDLPPMPARVAKSVKINTENTSYINTAF